jgi:large subunit ribosomal protein L22
LKSAIANAENNANLKPDGLVVKEAIVGEGPTLKRIMARARGSASRIQKRTSHIRIVLSDEIPIETREKRKAKREQAKKAAKKEINNEASESAESVAEKQPVKPKPSTKAKK